MMCKKGLFLIGVTAILISGCSTRQNVAPQRPLHTVGSEQWTKVKLRGTPYREKVTVNSLNTIIPQRNEEVIMRGVMMPYQANGVMHDSSFTYLVVKEASWKHEESTRLKITKRILGSVNGI